MSSFKKLGALFLIVLLIVNIFTGCTGKDNQTDVADTSKTDSVSTKNEDTTKKIDFTYATFFSNMETDQVGVAAIRYMELNQNIKIEYQFMPQDTYEEKISIMINAKTLPDMFWYGGQNLATALKDTDAILDISKYVSKEYLNNLYESANSFLKLEDGRIAGFPTELQIQGLWYNDAIFKECGVEYPKTFEDLIDACKVIREHGYIPFVQGTKDDWPLWYIYYMFQKYGSDELAQAVWGDKTTKFSEAFRPVYERLIDLREAGAFPEDNSTMSFDQMISSFLNGRAAIINLSSDQLGSFVGSDVEKHMVFSWGPDYTDSKYNQNIGVKTVNNGYGLSSRLLNDKEKLDAVIRFNEWRYSPEGYKIALDAGFVLPCKYNGDLSAYKEGIIGQIFKANSDNTEPKIMFSYAPFWVLKSSVEAQLAWYNPAAELMNACMDGSVTREMLDKEIKKVDDAIAAIK